LQLRAIATAIAILAKWQLRAEISELHNVRNLPAVSEGGLGVCNSQLHNRFFKTHCCSQVSTTLKIFRATAKSSLQRNKKISNHKKILQTALQVTKITAATKVILWHEISKIKKTFHFKK
jgi:hypothetical protein